MTKRNIAASIRARLLNHARETRQDFNMVLTRYALERLLYRISVSSYRDAFLLKGALLFDLWFDIPHRPTRDADLLRYGSAEIPHLKEIFQALCLIEDNDGIRFQSKTVSATEIRKNSHYTGVRITMLGVLDSARCPVQVDIGFGDVVTPAPETVHYPVIITDLEAPSLKVYTRYTVVAEKFEALTTLGIANSRMKDYFDLWVLSQYAEFDGRTLSQAIAATFERRKTPVPETIPFGLTPAFTQDAQKQTQWDAFLHKNGIKADPLHIICETLITFLMPIAVSVHERKKFTGTWPLGGPWSV
jgi:predicted nucleotidyltransferase component of viral defense system